MDNSSFNPEMLTIARESRGLTQGELAKRLSVSQGKISKIENGFISISADMLNDISQVLDYPTNFFLLKEKIYGPGLSGMGLMYHRKRKNIPTRTLDTIQAQINIRRIHLSKLLTVVGINTSNHIPALDIDDYSGNIEEIAQTVRATWSLPQGPIKNLTDVIEAAGGIIIRCDFGTDKIDALSQLIPKVPPLFFVNTRAPGDRLRFTLAHELGHIIMHRTPTPNMESEADRFASALLMPKQDIGPSLNSITLQKLATLKPYWKVSMAALLYRTWELQKISKRKWQYLWMQMGKLGYRKREPVELDIPTEDPSLLRELIHTYLKGPQYTISKLCQLLTLNEQEARFLYLGQNSHLSVVK